MSSIKAKVINGVLTIVLPQYAENMYKDGGFTFVKLGESQEEVSEKLAKLGDLMAQLPETKLQAFRAAEEFKDAVEAEAEAVKAAKTATLAEKERMAVLEKEANDAVLAAAEAVGEALEALKPVEEPVKK